MRATGTMVRRLAILTALLAGTALPALAGSKEQITEYPHVTLTNGSVTLTALLPDAERGYYRGPRFAWSGMIGRVEHAGYTWFGPVRTPHDPLGGEGAIGTAEEFGMGTNGLPPPLGYQEAKVGEPFLKIGVGLLKKTADQDYFFGRSYEIVQPGQWQVQSGPTWVEYRQQMSLGPWGYAYTERISLFADRPGFAIQHTLRNTGARAWEQGHYCHNFFSMDGEAIDQRYVVRFPFLPQAERDLGDKAHLIGRSLFMNRALPGEAVFTELAGLPGNNGGEWLLHRESARQDGSSSPGRPAGGSVQLLVRIGRHQPGALRAAQGGAGTGSRLDQHLLIAGRDQGLVRRARRKTDHRIAPRTSGSDDDARYYPTDSADVGRRCAHGTSRLTGGGGGGDRAHARGSRTRPSEDRWRPG